MPPLLLREQTGPDAAVAQGRALDFTRRDPTVCRTPQSSPWARCQTRSAALQTATETPRQHVDASRRSMNAMMCMDANDDLSHRRDLHAQFDGLRASTLRGVRHKAVGRYGAHTACACTRRVVVRGGGSRRVVTLAGLMCDSDGRLRGASPFGLHRRCPRLGVEEVGSRRSAAVTMPHRNQKRKRGLPAGEPIPLTTR